MRPRKRRREAVVEAINYVLIFSVIVVGMALVTFNATPALESAQNRQTMENAETGFQALQERVDEMIRHDAPRRSVSMNLHDSSLYVDGEDPTKLRIELDPEGEDVVTHNLSTYPVVFEKDDVRMLYSNGAVVGGDAEGHGMSSSPDWMLSHNSTSLDYMSLTTVKATGSGEVGGDGFARVELRSLGNEYHGYRDVDVTVTVVEDRDGVWERYLERFDDAPDVSIDHPPDAEVRLEAEEVDRAIYVHAEITAEVTRG